MPGPTFARPADARGRPADSPLDYLTFFASRAVWVLLASPFSSRLAENGLMAIDVRGKTVVLSGTFSKLKRAEAEARLAKLGAKIGSGVSKATDLLFAGEKAGSKLTSAGRLGVTVLGEGELMAILRGPGEGPAGASAFAGLDPSQAGDALARAVEALPWKDFDLDRDLPPLREALYAHEAAHGVTAAHRAATARVRPLAALVHAHGHDVEIGWADLSPDGRFLATGSWVGDDYDRGGVLQIWDVRAGRCVNLLRVRGGVGWPDYGPCVQWRPDGRRVGLTFDTNGVGSFDPFGKWGEPESCAYITDGWSRPPAWAWSPNSRDVYVACWGPNLALGAIVPLVGARPEPRWCQPVGRSDPDDENSEPRLQPMKHVSWRLPERIVGHSTWAQLFAIDAKTGKLLWEGKAHPPVSFSPDGEEFAMHPAGIAYYDAKTGLPNGKLPLHVGAESFAWSRDGSRLAAIVRPRNPWKAEPGVFVYDAGVYRYCPDAPTPRANDTYAVAFSPDGRKLAITSRGRLQIWELGDAPVLRLDVAAPGGAVTYGDGTLIAWGGFGLRFVRESDGAVVGDFKPAIEASGESPLAVDGDDRGELWAWNPAFPLDAERVAAALPEGVVIGPPEATASVDEIDRKIAWAAGRKFAWPWRWGETTIWPDAAAACADRVAPATLKRTFGKRVKAPARAAKSKTWPPPGGSLDAIAGLLEEGIRLIRDGYHGNDYRRNYAVRTMALGMFDRAAAALDGGPGWADWDPWFSAFARGETVMTALSGRVAGAPALTAEQTATLRRWLTEAEALLQEQAVQKRGPCRPLAVVGAGWLLLGEAKRGEPLLAAAVAAIEPEHNATEHRRVVAEAFAAIGRAREAIDHLTGGEGKPSWTQTPAAIVAITRRASAADVAHLFARMKAKGAHNEFVLLNRGLSRLIELRAWDAAAAWIKGFDGLATRPAQARLAAAMAETDETSQAEASLAARLKPDEASQAEASLAAQLKSDDARCADALLALARLSPERARPHLAAIAARAKELRHRAHYPEEFVAALAAAAARLGRLDLAAKVEALTKKPGEAQAARFAVLAELAPGDPAWAAWFARASAASDPKDAERLAVLASRGGLPEASKWVDTAIEAARADGSADLNLEALSGRLAAAGDFTGAHRVYLAIAKGRRSYRNGPLLNACVATKQWAGALELLAAMPMGLNGAPKLASKLLLELAGGEGW